MRDTPNGGSRRAATFSAVLLLHALIAWLLVQSTVRVRASLIADRLVIFQLPPPPRREAPALDQSPSPGKESSVRVPRTRAHETVSPPKASDAVPPALAPPIDWLAEQGRAAASGGQKIWEDLARHCRDAEANHIHPPECHRYVAPEPWKPEEGHVGMEGPLPWVRLGRCVVGLGFWGCAIGKRPPPDSHVFDGMRDPDRPGSVPDNGSYQPPPPPREPLH